jgi:hypothetical protein
MKISPIDAIDILSNRYPKPEELELFPFGSLLKRLWDRNDGDNADYQRHGPKVLEAMNTLLSHNPNDLLNGPISDADSNLLTDTKQEVERIFGRFNANTRALFRVAALYHDLGKYIIKERHPTIGWYTVQYGPVDEKNDLRALVGGREDYFQLLLIMIRDHDEFGVLATGEGSYPILLRAANSLGNQPDVQKQILSALMWLNLADIAGTPNVVLSPADLRKVINDWHWMLNAIDENQRNSRDRLEDYVIREASKEEFVEERITRLLLEASRNAHLRSKELRENNADPELVKAIVRNAIRTVYPTDIPRREFSSQLTHICKLDYGKRFFSRLVEYCEGTPTASGNSLPTWSEKYVSTEALVYSILAILRRLSSTYTSMTRSDLDHPGSLIGVEMKDLTPFGANEKPAQIIELLRADHYPGLSWMMSDCLAWYF